MRQVTTSAVDGSVTAVTSGLSPGERVVVDGTDRLRDGLKVSVAADPAAAPFAIFAAKRRPVARPVVTNITRRGSETVR